MDFTREPIIESIITPKEGHRIVVRSSKNVGHEEYFVDALEVVSFGTSIFFRSKEKPKPFLVPSTDYEVLEVREPRVLLKAPTIEGVVRIGGPKEPQKARETRPLPPIYEEKMKEELKEPEAFTKSPTEGKESFFEDEIIEGAALEQGERFDKKKEKRARLRKRKSIREEILPPPPTPKKDESEATQEKKRLKLIEPPEFVKKAESEESSKGEAVPFVATLLPPPPTLIRDDIERLRKDDTFKGAFFIKDDRSESTEDDDDDAPVVPQRLVFEEEDAEAEDISYRATPLASNAKDMREPFWVPPSKEAPPPPVETATQDTPQ